LAVTWCSEHPIHSPPHLECGEDRRTPFMNSGMDNYNVPISSLPEWGGKAAILAALQKNGPLSWERGPLRARR
jgi:hypothetical protein